MNARWLAVPAILLTASVLQAQEPEDRTLLTQEQMTAIINEVSGERAMHTILEMVPYQRVRPPSEYSEPYRESRVIAERAKEYGFSNVEIEEYGTGGTAWQPTQGELWMTSPKSVKLYDIHDIALALVSLNANGDISGDLVDVGAGRPEDFEGKDVTGKFLLSSGSSSSAYRLAVANGAIGSLGVSSLGFQRANVFLDQIVSSTASAEPGTALWSITPELHNNLQAMLQLGDKITVRSITQSVEVPSKTEWVHAEIPGDGSTTQEAAMSCHLYEGVIKQGANDDASGCALILEIGRAYIKLINEGELPPPKRTINFQFVQEISGTNAYLNAHPEKAEAMIGTLNFDMEALRVSESRSYWVLQRTPDTYPSYLNDVAQSMMEYIANVSRERVRYRRSGYVPTQPVESVHGSRDAFYIKIDKHYGSSDHVTYMQHGIPSVMFITWPDIYYHSSEDTPDKLDATQFKRAGAVGLGGLAVISTGTDDMAARVLADNVGRGLSRMGESLTKGLGYIADATSGAALTNAYNEARIAILHQAEVEKGVIRSASVLWTNAEDGKEKTETFAPLIDQRAGTLLDEVKATYQLQALQRGVEPVEPTMSEEDRAVADLVIEQVPSAGGGRGGRGGGRGAGGPALPDEMYNAELNLLLGREMTVGQIRDFLSGEFTPVPLSDVVEVLRAREAAGAIRLVPGSAGGGS